MKQDDTRDESLGAADGALGASETTTSTEVARLIDWLYGIIDLLEDREPVEVVRHARLARFLNEVPLGVPVTA